VKKWLGAERSDERLRDCAIVDSRSGDIRAIRGSVLTADGVNNLRALSGVALQEIQNHLCLTESCALDDIRSYRTAKHLQM
jgi:hypothetical protein